MPTISVFDIFKIGVGPSSSHTVGPMKSARAFTVQLAESGAAVDKIQVTLHGSLAYTGKGHGTDSAIILGLMGCEPETLDPDAVDDMLRAVHSSGRLNVSGVGDISFSGVGDISFSAATDLVFDYAEELPRHTNGMRFIASNSDGQQVLGEDYYSLGGGGSMSLARIIIRLAVVLLPVATSLKVPAKVVSHHIHSPAAPNFWQWLSRTP